jgi:predicted kinase
MPGAVTMRFSAEDLQAIYRDRHGRDLPSADAKRLLNKMRADLAQAMESGGYEVIIDHLWNYEWQREAAERDEEEAD